MIYWPRRPAHRVKIGAGSGYKFTAAGRTGDQVGVLGYFGVAFAAKLAHRLRINLRSEAPKGLALTGASCDISGLRVN